ncbi:MAG: hypothetical protein JO156_12405 [Solirubrobacterales bacterium]|nr:hypothetical protein [Solirubrobacterales bacterium]
MELPVGRAAELFDEHGELTDPRTRERLAEIVSAVLAQHDRLREAA